MADVMRSDFYEVLAEMHDHDEPTSTLCASFTPNNGIRVQIQDDDLANDWAVFDLADEQAEMLGHALVRWAQRRRAETELIRRGGHVKMVAP